jgi:hypothetical protein
MSMDADQLRSEVWHAMSELYLDDEMTVGTYLCVAERIAATAYELEELEEICFNEVHPALCWNLTAVAGQWGYFEKDWVRGRIINEINPDAMKENWFKRNERKRKAREVVKLRSLVKCNWEKVRLLVAVIRGRGLRDVSAP